MVEKEVRELQRGAPVLSPVPGKEQLWALLFTDLYGMHAYVHARIDTGLDG